MAQDKIQARVEPASAGTKPEVASATPAARRSDASVGAGAHGAPSGSAPHAVPAAGVSGQQASVKAPTTGAPASSSTGDAATAPGAVAVAPANYLDRAGAWLAETFPNSRHAVLGGICGLIVALLLFTIGVLDTLIVAVCIACGVAVGQYLDGDPKLARIVQSLIKRR